MIKTTSTLIVFQIQNSRFVSKSFHIFLLSQKVYLAVNCFMVISYNLSNDVTLFISMYMYALSLPGYKYLTQMKTLHTLASCYHEICHSFHKNPLHFFFFTHHLLSASLGFVFSVILTFHF